MFKIEDRKKFNRASLPLSAMLIIVSGIVLIFLALSITIIGQLQQRAKHDMDEMVTSTSELYATNVDSKLNNYFAGTDAIALNLILRDEMWRNDVSEMEMVTLGRKMQRNVDSITYSFYRSEEIYSHRIYCYLPTDGASFFNISRAHEQGWYKLMEAEDLGSYRWYEYSVFTSSNHLNIARLIGDYGITGENMASGKCYQTISINLSNLLSTSGVIPNGTQAEVFLFDNDASEIVYYTGQGSEMLAMGYYDNLREKWKNGYDASATDMEYDSKNEVYITSKRIKQQNMSVVMVYKNVVGTGSDVIEQGIILLIICVPLFLLLIFLILFYKGYRRRLYHIIKNIDEFDEKLPITVEPLAGNDELARIDQHSIKLFRRTKVLIEENYTQKLQRIMAQLETMAVCINPHFLYNTLNTISALACMEGADDTASAVGALSSMFRYSCDMSEKLVPMSKEVDNIRQYLSIQKIRYQNKLSMEIEIDEECMEVAIPKLSLQPIVENCFKHGFKSGLTKESNHREIVIKGKIVNDSLYVTVWDNGSGIEEESLESLRQMLNGYEVDSDDQGDVKIGIHNVNNRIKLIFGNEYGLDVSSEKGEYTQIKMRVPVGERGME